MVVLYYYICMCYNLYNQSPYLASVQFFFNVPEITACQIVYHSVLLGEGRGLGGPYSKIYRGSTENNERIQVSRQKLIVLT